MGNGLVKGLREAGEVRKSSEVVFAEGIPFPRLETSKVIPFLTGFVLLAILESSAFGSSWGPVPKSTGFPEN